MYPFVISKIRDKELLASADLCEQALLHLGVQIQILQSSGQTDKQSVIMANCNKQGHKAGV
jgi:hypothetical protein